MITTDLINEWSQYLHTDYGLVSEIRMDFGNYAVKAATSWKITNEYIEDLRNAITFEYALSSEDL